MSVLWLHAIRSATRRLLEHCIRTALAMAVTAKTVGYAIGFLCLCFLAVPVHIEQREPRSDLLQLQHEHFADFVRRYNKSYCNDTDEYSRRFTHFRASLIRAREKARTGSEARFGITKFSDMSPAEFRRTLLRHRPSPAACLRQSRGKWRGIVKRQVSATLPPYVDWRQKGIVSIVKNQQACGACWAFSIMATIESMHAMLTGTLQDLSVQQVIDCAKNGNMGCQGGDTCSALTWISSSNISLLRDKQYPLTLQQQPCKAPLHSDDGVRLLSNFTCLDLADNELELQTLLAYHGPVTVSVDAVSWQDYLGGVIRYHCEDNANHAVQIVGYDTRSSVPYYIVRNSWGTDFGLDGYIHIAIGANLCGIAREVSALSVAN